MRAIRLAVAFATVAVFASPIQSRAQSAQKRQLAIEDYYRIKTIGGISLSPDGKHVAFTVSTRLEENNGTAVEAWLVPWDGSSGARRISGEGTSVTGLAWDGAKLWLSESSTSRIYQLDPDNGKVLHSLAEYHTATRLREHGSLTHEGRISLLLHSLLCTKSRHPRGEAIVRHLREY